MKFSWEVKASHGEPMPDGLSLEEQAAYQALCALHARFGMGRINREQAGKEKELIYREYDRRKEAADFASSLCRKNAKLWKDIECRVYEYNEDPSVERADAILRAIYGVEQIRRPAIINPEETSA